MAERFQIEQGVSQKVIRNIMWNFFGQGVMLIISFLATPFIVHSLNVNLYGLYTLIGVIIGYFSFLQFGLGTASTKYISEYLARGEDEEIRKIFWTSLFTSLFIGLAGIVIIYAVAPVLTERIFRITADLQEVALFVMRMGSLGLLLLMLLTLFGSVIRATERFDLFNRLEVVIYTLQICLVVILLKLGFSLKAIIVSNLAVQSAGVYFYWNLIRRLLPFLIRPSWDIHTLTKLLKFGRFVTVSSVTGPILTNMEKIFLTALRSVSALTYYSVPYSLITRLSMIPSAVASAIFPTISYLQSSGRDATNNELHFRSTLYTLFICMFFVIFFILFGRLFLAVWVGNDFAENSTNILIILSAAVLINAVALPSSTVLYAMGKPHIPAMFHLIETLIYIPMGYVFIKKFGGTGAALVWFFRVFLDMFLLHIAACNLLKERVLLWYGKIFYHGFLPFLTCSLSFLCLKNFNLPFLNPLNIFGILLIFILYTAIIYKYGLDHIARAKVMKFFSFQKGRV